MARRVRLSALLLLVVVGGALLLSCVKRRAPERADGRFEIGAAQCLDRIARAGITPVRWDAPDRPNCPVTAPLVTGRTPEIVFDPSLRTSCPMLLAWVDFEPKMQAVARRTLESEITTVYHYGSYSCRRMRGRRSMSLHATAKALDVAAFRTRDGRTIDLLANWDGGGREERFLRAFAREACDHFNLVLTPEYDANHANHFHIDIGPWRICRD